MYSSAPSMSREEFVREVLASAESAAGELYEWLAENPRRMVEMEEEVMGKVRQMGRGMLKAACEASVARYPEPTVPCACGHEAKYVRHREGRSRTQLDWIGLKRPYYLCDQCHQGHYPLDARLGFRPGQVSEGLANRLAYIGALLPFEESAGLIERFHGLTISPTLVRQATEELGALVAAQEEQEIAAAWQTNDPQLPTEPDEAPPVLYVSMDGVTVPTLELGWKEQKLGAVYTAEPFYSAKRPDQLQLRAKEITFYTARAEAQDFGQGLYLEAWRRGAFLTRRLVVVGDGAHWIWRIAEEHFPHAIQILDWYHVTEYIWKAAHALHGEGNTSAKAWAEARLAELWEGQLDAVLECLSQQTRYKAVQETITYFRNNRHRMDYPHYRAIGLQIGSGTIESGCKHVIAHRIKQAGMRWSLKGLKSVAKLRARLKSRRWDDTIALWSHPLRSGPVHALV